jgi:glycosyltransferase involved in cell wall biosynthesis
VCAEVLRIEAGEIISQRLGEGGGPAVRDEHARATGNHRLPHAAGVDSDHRSAGRLGLDSSDAELLDARHHKRSGLGVQARELVVGDSTQEVSLASVPGLQPPELGPRADHLYRPAGSGRRLDCHLGALVAQEFADKQDIVGGLPHAEPPDVDRRVHDDGVPPPEAPDPLPRELTVGDVLINLERRAAVESPLAAQKQLKDGSRETGRFGERVLPVVPGVSERRMAVANVPRPLRLPHSVCEGAATRDNALETVQVQTPRRGGKQRQGSTEVLLADAKALQRGGRHGPVDKAPVRTRLVVEQGCNWGVGPNVADRGEGALGTPHDQEIVVNEDEVGHGGDAAYVRPGRPRAGSRAAGSVELGARVLRMSHSSRRLTLFVAHASALLTDHEPHGDGLLALNFLRRLAERGHELDVAVQDVAIKGRLPANLRLHRVMGGGDLGPTRRLRYAIRVRRLHRQLVRSHPYDLIHQLNPVDVGLTALLAPGPVPLVLGPYPAPWPAAARPRRGPAWIPFTALRAGLQCLEQRRAQAILVFVPAGAANVRSRRARGRIAVVPPGIDLDVFRPARTGERPERPSVLFLAALERRKGVDILLDAFEVVARSRPDVQLRLAGSGSLEHEIRSRAGREPLAGRVAVLGQVAREEVPTLLRSSTLLCLPSLGEPLGMSALEALASGLPVVATNTGGLADLVPDGGGRKVPAGDAEALARALDELLGLGPEEGAALAARNRAVAESYSWEAAVDRIEEVYASVVRR